MRTDSKTTHVVDRTIRPRPPQVSISPISHIMLSKARRIALRHNDSQRLCLVSVKLAAIAIDLVGDQPTPLWRF